MFMLFVETASDPDAILGQQAEDTEFYAATLKEMVGLGLEIGRIIHQQVVAQSIDSPHSPIPEGASLAFERVFRAVRRGIMLAKRLNEPAAIEPKPTPTRPEARPEARPDPRPEPRPESTADSPDIERFYADLRDRLDAPECVEDLANRPTLEIFNEIRKDLGLPPANPPVLTFPQRKTPPGTRPHPPASARSGPENPELIQEAGPNDHDTRNTS